MERLVEVRALTNHRLFLRFDDGTEGVVDLSARLRGPMFAKLHDHAYFARVELSEAGAPTWPHGLDLAPDALYQRLVAAQGRRGAA